MNVAVWLPCSPMEGFRACAEKPLGYVDLRRGRWLSWPALA